MIRMRYAVAGALSSSLLLPPGFAPSADGGPPPAAVFVKKIAREDLQEHRRVTGELRPRSRSRVATIEPGLVLELPVEEGDRVVQGAVIAVLDRRRLEIDKRRLTSRTTVLATVVEVWEGELEKATNDLAAVRLVNAQGSTSPKEMADAQSEVRIATARLEGAKMELEVLEAEMDLVATRLADMTIRAPFDGAIVMLHAERGEWVAEGAAIAEVVSVDSYEAWLQVPQRLAAALRPDPSASITPVRVELDAGARAIGSGTPVMVPLVDPSARTFSIYVRIDDAAGTLAPGMSVRGWVPTDQRGAYLTIPRDAMLRNPTGYYVYVARSAGDGPALATPVPVNVAFEAGDRVAVRDGGLRDGDLVVVEGNEGLFPMAPVMPIEIGPNVRIAD